jgi:hypothetical protein
MPVPNQITHSAQKACIIGEISKYVAIMLRAQKSYDSLQRPQRIADPQNVEGRLLRRLEFKPFKTFKQFKSLNECSRIGNL